MNNISVIYITEEEKMTILRRRLELERQANRKHVSDNVKLHRTIGAILGVFAFAFLIVGAEGIIGSILCGLFALIALAAKDDE